jgi:hypothetical protein
VGHSGGAVSLLLLDACLFCGRVNGVRGLLDGDSICVSPVTLGRWFTPTLQSGPFAVRTGAFRALVMAGEMIAGGVFYGVHLAAGL